MAIFFKKEIVSWQSRVRFALGRRPVKWGLAALRRLEKLPLGAIDLRELRLLLGRAMELAADRAEAARGYRACIAANPHTELAVRSRQRLKLLNRLR